MATEWDMHVSGYSRMRGQSNTSKKIAQETVKCIAKNKSLVLVIETMGERVWDTHAYRSDLNTMTNRPAPVLRMPSASTK